MIRGPARVVFVILVALVGLFAAAKVRYRGRPALKLPAADCNADLWQHIESPARLRVIEACTTVDGRVVSVRSASDGDLHIELTPDQKSVLNMVNVAHAGGHLVVEIVCDHPPTSSQARAVCSGFSSQLEPPRVGDRIRVTGTYVNDTETGWNEIHPVTKIEILR